MTLTENTTSESQKSEKFEHLLSIDAKVKNILNTPVEEINNDQLSHLDYYFKEKFSKHKNPDIVLAAGIIGERINMILSGGKNNFSGEILAATADDYNNQMAA